MTIKTVETQNEGLKRAFMLTIPAEDIEARLDKEVKRIAPQVIGANLHGIISRHGFLLSLLPAPYWRACARAGDRARPVKLS